MYCKVLTPDPIKRCTKVSPAVEPTLSATVNGVVLVHLTAMVVLPVSVPVPGV